VQKILVPFAVLGGLGLIPWVALAIALPPAQLQTVLVAGLSSLAVLALGLYVLLLRYRKRYGRGLRKSIASVVATKTTVEPRQTEIAQNLATTNILRAEKLRFEQAHDSAVLHLESGLERLAESRQEAELAVLRAGESVKKLAGLQKIQFDWITQQVAPRMSRSGSVPDNVRVLNSQFQSEIARLVQHLQFQDVLDQKLNKVAGADIGAAVLILSESQSMNHEQHRLYPGSSAKSRSEPKVDPSVNRIELF
jgi:hypothetical protein